VLLQICQDGVRSGKQKLTNWLSAQSGRQYSTAAQLKHKKTSFPKQGGNDNFPEIWQIKYLWAVLTFP